LEITKLFIERLGDFIVDTVDSASGALGLLSQSHYDAVISDYEMPGMNGIEFLKRIRTSGNTIPFIIFTGRGREEVVIQALNAGVDFYLQKGGESKALYAELAYKVRQAVQHRRTELQIRDMEQRESDFLNFLPDATFAVDKNGRVIVWNKAIEEMSGVPASQMLGKTNYEYAIPFYGARRPMLLDLLSAQPETLNATYTHVVYQDPFLIANADVPRQNGTVMTVMGKAGPLYNLDGETVGAVETIRDITDLRCANMELHRKNDELRLAYEQLSAQEEELRSNYEELNRSQQILREHEQFINEIVSGVHEGIVVYDPDLRVTFWNKFMEDMTGLPSETVCGRIAPELFPFLRESAIDNLINQALSGVPGESQEFPFYIKSTGRKGWAKGLYSPHANATGKIIGVIGVIREVARPKEN